MDSSELKSQQIDALKSRIDPLVVFLRKLKQRSLEMQFPDGDKLLEATSEAVYKLEALAQVLNELKAARMNFHDYLDEIYPRQQSNGKRR
jgi:hypothetical protein